MILMVNYSVWEACDQLLAICRKLPEEVHVRHRSASDDACRLSCGLNLQRDADDKSRGVYTALAWHEALKPLDQYLHVSNLAYISLCLALHS